MGDTARESTERLQALRLADVRFQAIHLAHVVLHGRKRERLALLVPHQERADLGVDQLAGERVPELPGALIAAGFSDHLGAIQAVLGVERGQVELRHVDLGVHAQELPPGLIDEQHVAVERGHGDELAAVLDQCFEAFGSFLGAPALADLGLLRGHQLRVADRERGVLRQVASHGFVLGVEGRAAFAQAQQGDDPDQAATQLERYCEQAAHVDAAHDEAVFRRERVAQCFDVDVRHEHCLARLHEALGEGGLLDRDRAIVDHALCDGERRRIFEEDRCGDQAELVLGQHRHDAAITDQARHALSHRRE